MKYETVVDAVFLQRPNRFIAHCLLDGEEVVAHVKNTGRCRELLLPGVHVVLQDHRQEQGTRKTAFSLIAVEKNGLLINMDSQAPNTVAEEALHNGSISLPLGMDEKILSIRREVKYGQSRFDLKVTTTQKEWFVEVKGVTLEETVNGYRIARFPDAPTERGIKHIHELIQAKNDGYGTAILFIIQMENVDEFQPNWNTHQAFGCALQQAEEAGVSLLAYDCHVEKDGFVPADPVKVVLTK